MEKKTALAELPNQQPKTLSQKLSEEIGEAISTGTKFNLLLPSQKGQTIMKVYAICGLKTPSQGDYDLFAATIESRFKWITDKEILQAFQMNAFGDLKETTEFFGIITVANLSKVINQYQERRNPVKLQIDKAANNYELCEGEKEILRKQWDESIEKAKVKFQETGEMPLDAFCGAMWDTLHKKKCFDLTSERREELYSIALSEIIAQHRANAMAEGKLSLIRSLESGVISSGIQTEAKNRAKKKHLMEFWKG